MRKIVTGIVIGLFIVFGFRYCEFKKDEKESLVVSTNLIEKQLQNVGKLIVTEGTYGQVHTFEDTERYMRGVNSTKKALVISNAKATVAYDLKQIVTEIDKDNKTVTITQIPEPILSIDPNIEYFDIENGIINRFDAEDHNEILRQIEDSLRTTIGNSDLMANAQNRLISELQKLYILTNSMGWTLRYQEQEIKEEQDLQTIKL